MLRGRHNAWQTVLCPPMKDDKGTKSRLAIVHELIAEMAEGSGRLPIGQGPCGTLSKGADEQSSRKGARAGNGPGALHSVPVRGRVASGGLP